MPDIHIERAHQLGLAKARKVALQWAEEAEKKLDVDCTILEGEDSDTVEFTRMGVKGTLLVEADRFTLDAKLGFLLGAFAKTIETEIERNLDDLLASRGGTASAGTAAPKPPSRAAAKKAPAKPAAPRSAAPKSAKK